MARATKDWKTMAPRRLRARKLSTMLLAAIKDLQAAERSEKYVIDMSTWHEPVDEFGEHADKPKAVCEVCFAGAVLAMRIKMPPNFYSVGTETEFITAITSAINNLRNGLVRAAYFDLIECPDFRKSLPKKFPKSMPTNVPVAGYGDSPKARAKFHGSMRRLVKRLAKNGL